MVSAFFNSLEVYAALDMLLRICVPFLSSINLQYRYAMLNFSYVN
jgi:hypothetical protein